MDLGADSASSVMAIGEMGRSVGTGRPPAEEAPYLSAAVRAVRFVGVVFWLSGAGVCAAETRADPRMRTYGRVTLGDTTLPFRRAHSVLCGNGAHRCKDDYIKVGELDAGQVGHYKGLEDEQILKHWMVLRRQRQDRDWWNPIDWPGYLGDRVYRALVHRTGAEGRGLYAMDVLDGQIRAEAGRLPHLIREFVKANRTDATGRFVDVPVVFEVGNEPNIYLYMPPDLYAGYYLRWRSEILKAVAVVNCERSSDEAIRPHFMPAGLWIFEGLPPVVLKALQSRIRFGPLVLWPGVITDTTRYYREFVDALGGAPSAYIDVGNLHFYPYIHRYAAFGEGELDRHLEALAGLAAYVAERCSTGRVWMTEMGNINPFDDRRTADEVMTPIVSALLGNAVPQIDRWYWFMARGDDSKFDSLDLVADGIRATYRRTMWRVRLFNAIPLVPNVRLSATLSNDELDSLDALLADYRAQTPVQGLTDRSGRMREVGRRYLSLAVGGTGED